MTSQNGGSAKVNPPVSKAAGPHGKKGKSANADNGTENPVEEKKGKSTTSTTSALKTKTAFHDIRSKCTSLLDRIKTDSSWAWARDNQDKQELVDAMAALENRLTPFQAQFMSDELVAAKKAEDFDQQIGTIAELGTPIKNVNGAHQKLLALHQVHLKKL